MTVWIQNPFDGLPFEGGRKQRYWLMSEAFLRAGHRVVYWTADFSHSAKERRRPVPPDAVPEGMEVRFVPTRPYPFNVCLARQRSHRAYAADWKRMALADNGDRPSLVVTSMPTISAAEAALEVARRLGARAVVDVQDAWPETFERLFPRCARFLARAVLAPWRRRARRVYRDADVVTGVCDRYRELTGRGDYYRAYLGIERTAPSPAGRDPDGVVRLVYSGNLGRSYDLETIVQAVRADGSMELDVAGFGEFSADCPRVRFHGLLPAAALAELYARCDIGVIPMRDDSWVGVPNKMFDYAAAGLRIVSSLGGEAAALVAKYGCGATYSPGDAASFAEAVGKCAGIGRGASVALCDAEFDAVRIYDNYVQRVLQ